MNKFICIIGFIFVCVGCNFNNSPKEKKIYLASDEQLFHISALNDTLYHLMETIGKIPNPINAPKFNNIIFCYGFYNFEGDDTLVVYLAELKPYEINEIQQDYLLLKGGCKINGEHVLVYYEHMSDLKHIVNENLLSVDYVENARADIPKDTIANGWTYDSYAWVYKLKGDSLILQKKIDFTYKGLDSLLW